MDDKNRRTVSDKDAPNFLSGGGEMGALMRAHDWSNSSLGDPAGWPQTLRTAVRLMLNSGHPMYIWWGADGACLYNDAYRQSIGPERHPSSLGRPAREVWDEIWHIIGPQIEQVMSGRGATWNENQLVPITRHGKREDVYWTYSYSPIDDETATNGVGGVLVVCSETTQQVQAEKRLIEMFDQAPSFIAMLEGPDYRVQFANEAYIRMTGNRTVIGQSALKSVPDDVREQYRNFLDNLSTTGKAFSARGAKVSFKATPTEPELERYVDFIYQPILDQNGKVKGVFIEGSDVTEREQARIDLHELNRTLEARIEQRTAERNRIWSLSRDLLVVVGKDGAFRAANPAWSRILGYDPEEVTGRSYLDFIHPDDVVTTQQQLNRSSGEGLFNFENRYLHKDGSTRWISWHTSLEVELYYAFGRDVTAEKLADEALEQSKTQLRALFETSFQFQGLLSLNGVLLDANRTSLAAIGCEREDVIGRAFWDTPWFINTPGMSEMVREGVECAAAGENVRREIEVNLPAGGWRWFDFVLRPMRDAQGAIVAIVPEATEVTERKLAEEALRQSQKLDAMGQLTGGVAHDFNNLLTPIIGGLDALQRRRIGDTRDQRLIDGALQSAEKARVLVQRLLAFARRQPLQPTAVNVGDLITNMADLVASTSGPQIKVQVHVEENLPFAKADPNQLEMAVLNLSVNARDAMPEGGTLTISAAPAQIGHGHKSKLTPGTYVWLAVADTGTGMDEATLARAIEPFFSTKGIGKGTGLGLSMVHGLASQLGGDLNITSKPGLGTSVELLLPIAPAATASPQPAHEELAEESPARGTALVVDDETLVRMITLEMLDDLGFKTLEASSAAEALRIVESGAPIDIVITDHLMPGMTGVELVRAIRERKPDMPVLIVSGFADAEGIAPDLPRLTKPFHQADLAASLALLAGE